MPRKPEPKLTNRVREFRSAEPGLTQAALAEQIGVTRQTIVALEAGGYVPSLALGLRLARVLGKRVDELFTLED